VAVGLDVLDEGATECDVEEFVAAADAKDGNVAIERLVEEPQFMCITLLVGAVGLWAALFAVEVGVNVDAAG
jgi:hypothetical protein